MMMAVSDIFLLLNGSPEAYEKKAALWEYLKTHTSPQVYRAIRTSIGGVTNQSTALGNKVVLKGYRLARKISNSTDPANIQGPPHFGAAPVLIAVPAGRPDTPASQSRGGESRVFIGQHRLLGGCVLRLSGTQLQPERLLRVPGDSGVLVSSVIQDIPPFA